MCAADTAPAVWVIGRRSAWPKDLPFDAEPPCSFVALASAGGNPIDGSRCSEYFTGPGHFERATAAAEQLRAAEPSLPIGVFYGVSIEGAEAVMAARPGNTAG